MPVVQIEMFAGRTLEQKRAMAKDVTEALTKTINCKPEDVKIIIRELSRENLAEGGALFIDKLANSAACAAARHQHRERS